MANEDVVVKSVDLIPYEGDEYEGFTLRWSANIGWGEYSVSRKVHESEDDYEPNPNPWLFDSEYIDNDKRWFLKMLFDKWIDQLKEQK